MKTISSVGSLHESPHNQTASPVAQTGSLLFRRLAIGTARQNPGVTDIGGGCGMPFRDTADCQSALRTDASSKPRFWQILPRLNRAFAAGCALLLSLSLHAEEKLYSVGVAKIDITPDYPIRLHGYLDRKTESEGVLQHLFAKALAIGTDKEGPAILISVDNCMVPEHIRTELLRRLAKKGVVSERFAICSSHTHSAPKLAHIADNIFGMDIPPEQQAHIDRYTKELTDKMERVALAALKDRKPATLSWGQTKAGFAANRRTPGGPTDHDVPVLKVADKNGKIRGLLVNYACHCTTLTGVPNKCCADWAGFAQEYLEKENPGAVALTVIGCGADANPSPRPGVEMAQKHGAELSGAVNELLKHTLTPLHGKLECRTERIALPFDKIPTREDYEKIAKDPKSHFAAVYAAKKNIARLDRGETLPTEIPYLVETWNFGDELGMVFLPGEVVVDYSLRLKKEFDATRLWVNAYANDVPCYVPSKRILKEGGYEGGLAMIYYDRPTKLAPATEDLIIGAVHDLMPKSFLFDEKKAGAPPPKSPEEALATFRTKSDLVVDLVASEPLIVDPVAIDFSVDGKLWVVEMRDYPMGLHGNWEPGGRVKVLESTKHDGKFDKATVFCEGFPFPTGLMAWGKGALICSAPDILYAEDTDGDGKADVVKKLYSGFATHNFQARVNSPRWGLDGWVYFAAGLFGGKIHSHVTGKDFDLSGRDFRIHPDLGDFEPVSGLTQQTRVRDDFGHWFGNNNSALCFQFPLPDHYLRRNLNVTTPDASVNVPKDADPNLLYPTSRTLERYNNPQSANRTTSACGLEIYRDDLLGKEFYGNAFTCEPVHNLVHRLVMERDGILFSGVRAADEQKSEFLSSTDNWFRPVEVRTGPDGALWVVDMYRFVIEHPRWIPPDMLAKLDVRAGEDKGRIYRIYPRGAKLRPVPNLKKLSTTKLVAALDTPNGSERDLVHRELLERKDPKAAEPLADLVQGAKPSKFPQVRVQAVCVLDALAEASLAKSVPVPQALEDSDTLVRANAIHISERFLGFPNVPALNEGIAKLANDPDIAVRLQLALSLGEWDDPRAGKILGELAQKDGDNVWMRAAILSSGTHHSAEILKAALASDKLSSRSDLIAQLIATAVKSDKSKIPAVIAQIVPEKTDKLEPWRLTALTSLLEASGSATASGNVAEQLKPVFTLARNISADKKQSDATRDAAIRLLGHSGDEQDIPLLAGFLKPGASTKLEKAAFTSLQRSRSPQVAKLLLEDWQQRSPSLRLSVIEALLNREEWTTELLNALENKTISTREISLENQQRLLKHSNTQIQKRAEQILAASRPASRKEVLEKFKSTASLTGDRGHGAAVFEKNCSSCHAFRGVGHAVGPDLTALHDKEVDYFVFNILDPNAVIEPRFINYQIETKDGRSLSGVISGETATTLTLVQGGGVKENILRSDISEMRASSLSLMPEGLEQNMTPQDLADLIAHLKSGMIPRFGSGTEETIAAARKEFASAGGSTGARKILEASEKIDYPSWLGTLPFSHCRQTDGSSKLVWMTQPVPKEIKPDDFQVFRVACGMGMFSDKAAGFDLKLNGKPLLKFDVVLNDHTWQSADGNVRLTYAVRENNTEDSNGVLTIEIKNSLMVSGHAVKFEVDAGGAHSQRWFGIYSLPGNMTSASAK